MSSSVGNGLVRWSDPSECARLLRVDATLPAPAPIDVNSARGDLLPEVANRVVTDIHLSHRVAVDESERHGRSTRLGRRQRHGSVRLSGSGSARRSTLGTARECCKIPAWRGWNQSIEGATSLKCVSTGSLAHARARISRASGERESHEFQIAAVGTQYCRASVLKGADRASHAFRGLKATASGHLVGRGQGRWL
jgi:hypothetical protein